jgi:hypothetical protein
VIADIAFTPIATFPVAFEVTPVGLTSINAEAGVPEVTVQLPWVFHDVPLKMYSPAIPSVWYTISPVAGLAIAVRCAAVTRGGKNPLSVADNSRAAVAAGDDVPIPTWLRARVGIAAISSIIEYLMCAFLDMGDRK